MNKFRLHEFSRLMQSARYIRTNEVPGKPAGDLLA